MLYINEFELENVFIISECYLPDVVIFVDREDSKSVLEFIDVVYSLTYDFGDALFEAYNNPIKKLSADQLLEVNNTLRDIHIALTYLELLYNKVISVVNAQK